MRLWKRAGAWFEATLGRARMECEMDAELRFHVEARVEDLVRRGLGREEARRQAHMEFGGVERAKEECRDARGVNFVEGVMQDLRHAFRTLRKSPGFTTVAVLTLALGIAINATMFSLVSAYLMRRPSAHQPERIMVVSSVNPGPVFQPDAYPVSAPNYLAWRAANHVFSEMTAADEYRTVTLTVQGQSTALRGAAVSANYFSLLGVSPEFGRTFSDGEDQAGRDHVAILSHELWVQRFGSDPMVVGRTVRLNRENYAVVGVMPSDFRLLGYTRDLWTPLTLGAEDQAAAARKDRSLRLFGRLKRGATIEEARAELTALGRRAEESFPDNEKGWGVSVRTLPDFLTYNFGIRTALAILMTAVGFVLLIACGNVAGLLLTRAAGRQRELAVRISLGASRLRIVRQMLTEGLVIALLGGAAGLLFAVWGVSLVRAGMTFNEEVSAVPVGLDWNVVLFALGVSVLSAGLCGFVPALKASRTNVNANLKDESRSASAGQSHSRVRKILVTTEIALALFLLVGTGLLIRGIYLLEHQTLGFQVDHLLTASVTLDSARYKDATRQIEFVREVIPHIESIPGVEDVAATSDLPASGPDSVSFSIRGQVEQPSSQPLSTLHGVVSIDYFRTAGIPVLKGRAFTEMDDSKAPKVVVVSQEFVHRHLRDQEPLGKQVRLQASGGTGEWSEIVGVVGDVRTYSEASRYDPEVYEPLLQQALSSFLLMVRTRRDPSSLASDLRNAVGQVDEELPLDRVMSMPAVIDKQKRGDALFVVMMGVFAALALTLAAIGIYALIAYSVGQRTREIGIRMALGAGRGDVLRIVLWEGLKMTGIGAVIGLLPALALPKIFEAVFFDLHLQEPPLYFFVPAVIFVVAMAATYIPAWRATRVDPMAALRYE
jgi:putative ABC transport system permease protein